MKRSTNTTKPKTLLMIRQSLSFIHICVRKMILYQILVGISKGLFLSMTLCSSTIIDEENIVFYVDFDCGITFYPEIPTKFRQINHQRIYFSKSGGKPKCFPNNGQHNCAIAKQHTSNILVNPYHLGEMVPAALKLRNYTNDWDSLSNQYPQPTNIPST